MQTKTIQILNGPANTNKEVKLEDQDINITVPSHVSDELYYLQMKLPLKKITEEFLNRKSCHLRQDIPQIKIREVKKSDQASLLNIHNLSWKESHILFRSFDEETFEILFECPETKFLIASTKGRDIGYIILDYDGPRKQYGMIDSMGILPEYQGKTIGLLIALFAWEFLKKLNFEELRCEVFIGNKKCIGFLKFLGFEVYGIKKYPKTHSFN